MDNYTYKIKSIVKPVPDLLILELTPPAGSGVFKYRPGQYVMIAFRGVNGAMEEKHAFSIESSPTEVGVLRLGIRKMGRFTQALSELEIGSEMRVFGPYGSFIFDEKKHFEAVFLAGGIGITPFLSALKYATDQKLPNRMSLIASNRTLAGTPFMADIQAMAKQNPNIKTLFSVTDEKTATKQSNIINERVSLFTIKDFVGTLENKTFFLCGPAPFMAAMKLHLQNLAVPDESILMEEFAMISNQSFSAKIKYLSVIAGYSTLAMLLPFYLIYAANNKPIGNTSGDDLFKEEKGVQGENKEPVVEAAIERLPTAVPKALNSIIPSAVLPSNSQAGLNNVASNNSTKAVTNKPITNSVTKKIKAIGSNLINQLKATQKQTPLQNTNTQQVAPKPVTSASTAAATNKTTQTTTQTTPTPVTSVSGAPAASQSATTQTTSPAPTPVTSASAPASSVSGATTPGTTATVPTTRRGDDD